MKEARSSLSENFAAFIVVPHPLTIFKANARRLMVNYYCEVIA